MSLTVFCAKGSSFYPSAAAIDEWTESLKGEAEEIPLEAELLSYCPVTTSFGNNPNTLLNQYVRFIPGNGHRPFYGYWQPAFRSPAPLLINLPGYGGCISNHPQLVDQGYHILHISPLGYVEPDHENARMKEDGNWPVLRNTARGAPGGYRDWLLDCLLAIRWAKSRPEVLRDRISFFGTSQGGGGSLLLASILRDTVRCVCADLPFLTNFPLSGLRGDAYGILEPIHDAIPPEIFWNNLGLVDTLSHAHRLTMPVLLTAGGNDGVCPPATIERLFERLPGTKQYTYLREAVHTHTREGMAFFGAWLKLYA